MNEFAEYYKTITTDELLEIIENPQNYQHAAVLAAKIEIASRNLTEEEMAAAHSKLNLKKTVAVLQLKEKQENRDKNIQSVKKIFDQISPVKEDLTSGEKAIRRIVLIYCFFLLYWIITDFSDISLYIVIFPEDPLNSLLYLFPHVLMIMGLFQFWRKKPTGWTLLCFCFIYTAVPALYQLFDPWTWNTAEQRTFLDVLGKPNPIELIVLLVLFIGSLLMICRKSISEIFEIKKKKMTTTIVFSIIISFALWLYSARIF
jgi:hypothetical protein